MGYITAPRSKEQLLMFAESVRNLFRLENEELLNVLAIVECLHMFDPSFHYEYCEDHEVEDMGEGFFNPANNKMIIPESVYELACMNDGRARFTISHELGHKFLDHQVTFARNAKNNKDYPIYRDTEWQANVFSSYFLAPPRLVVSCQTVEQVVQRFGLSQQAAEIALENAKKAKS